ncbi:glycosyltransferase [Natronorubrum texcoconense]|uniref:Glycosyl transferase family 2 n=1 Tax=Natronorubrum texcoconense TaxID=1095776 RepID=A0A1G8XER1_9EURY|nr:glycosyltransferase [Natronorubrum texcoconense]SDJ88804.1 Glycosyl transferase family 2 [Natronorubrum texcoconense]
MNEHSTHDEPRGTGAESGEQDVDAGERPQVSVVVPVYNDPTGLRETLASLAEQTYPTDAHEILVVDNGSTDETPAVAREFADDHDRITVLVEDEIQSSYAARNRGIEHADGEILAFVDADMIAEDEWLVDAVDAFERTDAEYMGCNVEMVPSENSGSLAERYNLRTGFPIDHFIEDLGFAPTCCLFVHRSVIDDVGPFDSRLISGGDREFGHRVRDSGRALQFAPEATIYHPTRSTAEAILRKSRRVGRGVYQLRVFHPDRYDSTVPVALNPVPYLPPRPERVRSVDGWSDLSRREKMGFYLLSYARGVCNGLGRLEETLRRRASTSR